MNEETTKIKRFHLLEKLSAFHQRKENIMKKNNNKWNERLLSLDALRGFDMFFIMGGAAFIASLAVLFPYPFFKDLAEQMTHVSWHGLHHHDTIFPLFLFIAGVSFPFSFEKQVKSGKTTREIILKILRRGFTLVLLGCIYNGLFDFQFENLRIASVLGRIGLAWMFAALFYKLFSLKVRIGISVALLLGYWLLMAYVPVPGTTGEHPFSFEHNWAGYIDQLLMPGVLYQKIFDPEGLCSTFPAIVTAMLGVFTGEWLKTSNSTKHKLYGMIIAGVALLVIGLVWNEIFPINKKMWTSSFVCVVGAYSILMLALFYAVIDVWGFRRWTFFFRVIGLNSITIYLAQKFIHFSFTSKSLFGGTIHLLPESLQPLMSSLAYISVCWLFLLFLYRKKVFLKV